MGVEGEEVRRRSAGHDAQIRAWFAGCKRQVAEADRTRPICQFQPSSRRMVTQCPRVKEYVGHKATTQWQGQALSREKIILDRREQYEPPRIPPHWNAAKRGLLPSSKQTPHRGAGTTTARLELLDVTMTLHLPLPPHHVLPEINITCGASMA